MNNAIYVGLSKSIGQYRNLDVIANNVANVNTPGYQEDSMLFSEYISDKTDPKNKVSYALDKGVRRNTTQGSISITQRDFDFAINGSGYFMVESAAGDRYTRNGRFTIDSTGTLITASGDPVLDAGKSHIVLPADAKKIEVRENGAIFINDSEFAKIGIVNFEHEAMLKKVSNSQFSSDSDPEPAKEFRLVQGAIEESNAKSVIEITKLVDAQRSFSGLMEVINTLDDLQLNAIRTLGKAAK